MVRIPDVSVSTAQQQISPVVERTEALEVVGQALEGVAKIKREAEERDARAFRIKAGSELELAGTELLAEATNEAETPDEISDLFFEKYNTRKEQLLGTAPNDIAREEFNLDFEQKRAKFGNAAIRTQVAERQKFRMNALNEGLDDKITAIRSGRSFSDVMQLIDSDLDQAKQFTSPSTLQEIRSSVRANARSAQVDSLLENGDVAGAEAIINNEESRKDLTAGQVDSFRGQIQRIKKEQQSQLQISNYLNSDQGFLDPKNTQTKKAVDAYYKVNLEGAFLQGDPTAFNQVVGMTARTGVVPASVEGYIRSAYINNDQAGKVQAYQFISDVQKTNPNALAYSSLGDKVIEEALFYNDLREGQVPEQDAYNFVQNEFRPEDPAVTKVRQQRLQKGDDALKIDDVNIADLFDEGIFGFELDILDYFTKPDILDYSAKQDAFRAKYKSLYDKYYIDIGNKELAEKRAAQVFKRLHGESKITNNSEYVTDYPPEKYYSLPQYMDSYEGDMNYLWMRDQLKTEAQGFLNRDVNYEDLRLIADGITEREVQRGMLPTYQIFIKTEDEGLQLVGRIRFDQKKAIKDRRSELGEQKERASKRQRIETEMSPIIEEQFNIRFP